MLLLKAFPNRNLSFWASDFFILLLLTSPSPFLFNLSVQKCSRGWMLPAEQIVILLSSFHPGTLYAVFNPRTPCHFLSYSCKYYFFSRYSVFFFFKSCKDYTHVYVFTVSKIEKEVRALLYCPQTQSYSLTPKVTISKWLTM